MELLGKLPLEVDPEIALIGDYAVVDGDTDPDSQAEDAWLIDVRDPQAPSIASRLDAPGRTEHIAAWGERAYASYSRRLGDGGSEAGIAAWDISDSASPRLLQGGVLTSTGGGSLAADDSYVHAGYYGGVHLVEVVDGAWLWPRGRTSIAETRGPILIDRRTRLAGGKRFDYAPAYGPHDSLPHRLRVFEVTDPDRPSYIKHLDVPAPVLWMAQDGRYLYAVAYDRTNRKGASLIVIDVSNPSTARIEHTMSLSSPPLAIAVDGQWAYVASNPAHIDLYNLSDPSRPQLAGTFPTTHHVIGLAARDGLLYATAKNFGIYIFRRIAGTGPTLTATSTATTTPSATATVDPNATPSPTPTPARTATGTPTSTASATDRATATDTAFPTTDAPRAVMLPVAWAP